MKKLLILLLGVIFFYLFRSIVFASEINITSYPSSVQLLEEFKVNISFLSLDPNSSYYIKAIGGDDLYDVQTYSDKTSSYLSWNAPWGNFPEFSTNEIGSSSVEIKSRFKEGTNLGSNQLKIRIRKIDTSDNIDSDNVNIDVTVAPTSMPTSTPTLIPTSTNTPTSTKTQSPTNTPTVKPTVKAVNSPTSTPKLLSENTETPGQILGEEKSEESSKSSILVSGAKISLVLGLLFSGVAIIIFTQKIQNFQKKQ